MLEYLGRELLDELYDYYMERLKLADERGFREPGSRYNWLYEELKCRALMIDKTRRFLNALPCFMKDEAEERSFQYVISYVSGLFKPEAIGDIAHAQNDKHPYFNDSNPYWNQTTEVFDDMGVNYDTKQLPMLYVDLSEYVVRSVRLYLYIRESHIHAIDRGKFDQLMKLTGNLSASA